MNIKGFPHFLAYDKTQPGKESTDDTYQYGEMSVPFHQMDIFRVLQIL